jgi:branched-chain amino acid transport system permease protein
MEIAAKVKSAGVATRPPERRATGVALRNFARLGIIAAVGAYYAAGSSSANLFQFNSCMLAAVGALALNLLMGTAGQPSLGSTAFLGLGGFGTVALLHAGLPFVPALVVVALGACVGGLMLGLPSLRLRGVYLALATLGAYFFLSYVGTRYEDADAGPAGFVLGPLFGTAPDLVQQRYWLLVLFLLLAVTSVGLDLLSCGRIGRALRMIRDHEAAAPALGIRVTSYKLAAFVLYAALTAIIGGLGAPFVGNVSTDSYTLNGAIAYVAMIVIGGEDSISGAMLGAFIVTLLPTFVSSETTAIAGSTFSATYGPSVSEGIYGLAILVLVSAGRGGLAGLGRTIWQWGRRQALGHGARRGDERSAAGVVPSRSVAADEARSGRLRP